MKRLLIIAALGATLLTGCRTARVQSAATPLPQADTSFSITLIGEDCKFADHVDYGIYVPSTAEKIRGVMVFQHGCSQEEFGISRHCDVQYQAFARKWDLAIIEPAIYGLCDVWAYPENGSYKALLLALTKAGARTAHPELAEAPLLVWGHSGGGFWVLSMLHEHPERLIAAVAYSAAWDPLWDYLPEAYEVPILFRHSGPGEGADNIPATARHSFAHLRAHDAPASIAYTKGENHNHSHIRSITIPFWEAALQQRLAEDGSLKPLDRNLTYLADTLSFNIYKESDFIGDKSGLCLLPDYTSAVAWREYATQCKYTDPTAPDAPYDLRTEQREDGLLLLRWKADADIESGIYCFNIYKDGQPVGRVPENGCYQNYDTNGDQARPVIPPAMELCLPSGDWKELAVEMVNRDGLVSEKAVLKH